MMALKAEKEELAKLAEDPLKVNTDEEARKRLQNLRNQQQQFQQRQRQQQEPEEEDAELAGRAGTAAAADGDPSVSGRGGEDEAADRGAGSGAEAEGEEGSEAADPYAGMSARQRKLHDLRQKLQQCRKANEHAIIAERKRMKVRGCVSLQQGLVEVRVSYQCSCAGLVLNS
jgi:hypothetical protein